MYIWNKKIVKETDKDWLVEVTFDDKSKHSYTKKSILAIKTKWSIDATALQNIWSKAISKDITKVISNIDLSKIIDLKNTWDMEDQLEKIQVNILKVIMEYWPTLRITLESLTSLDNLYNVIIKKVTNSLQFSINKAILKPFWVDYEDEVSLLDIDKALKD